MQVLLFDYNKRCRNFSIFIEISQIFAAAFFVFFSAAAGAGVITADLRLVVFNLLNFLLALRRLRGGPLALGYFELIDLIMFCLADVVNIAAALTRLKPDAEDNIRHTVLDAFEHLVKHAMTFVLVFDLRVFFGIGPQHDAFLQVVHTVEMVFPRAVINLQEDIAFQVGQLPPEEIPSGLEKTFFGFFRAV